MQYLIAHSMDFARVNPVLWYSRILLMKKL